LQLDGCRVVLHVADRARVIRRLASLTTAAKVEILATTHVTVGAVDVFVYDTMAVRERAMPPPSAAAAAASSSRALSSGLNKAKLSGRCGVVWSDARERNRCHMHMRVIRVHVRCS
jgi:hypothetical protein